MRTEAQQLKVELGRAWRALHAYSNAQRKGEMLDDAVVAYHQPTVGAAARFVREGSVEGSEYFVGKPISVLHDALTPRA